MKYLHSQVHLCKRFNIQRFKQGVKKNYLCALMRLICVDDSVVVLFVALIPKQKHLYGWLIVWHDVVNAVSVLWSTFQTTWCLNWVVRRIFLISTKSTVDCKCVGAKRVNNSNCSMEIPWWSMKRWVWLQTTRKWNPWRASWVDKPQRLVTIRKTFISKLLFGGLHRLQVDHVDLIFQPMRVIDLSVV